MRALVNLVINIHSASGGAHRREFQKECDFSRPPVIGESVSLTGGWVADAVIIDISHVLDIFSHAEMALQCQRNCEDVAIFDRLKEARWCERGPCPTCRQQLRDGHYDVSYGRCWCGLPMPLHCQCKQTQPSNPTETPCPTTK